MCACVCVCVWVRELHIRFSSDILCGFPCVCVVCVSATSVCLCLHLCICAFCQCRAGKQSTIDQMRRFLHKYRAWLHENTSVHREIPVSLPSCLSVWFEGFRSLAAQSYHVCWKQSDDAMNLGSNKQISVLICMNFKHLHLYLEDIWVDMWAVCGMNMTRMGEPCCVGQALHFKAVCQSRSAMQQTNFPAEHHQFSRIESNVKFSVNHTESPQPISTKPHGLCNGSLQRIHNISSLYLAVSHD